MIVLFMTRRSGRRQLKIIFFAQRVAGSVQVDGSVRIWQMFLQSLMWMKIKFTAWTLLCCWSRRHLHQVQNTKKTSAEIIKVTIQNTLGCKEVKSNTTGVKANIEMIFKILKPHRIFRNRELLLINPPSICRWSKNLLARPYNYVLSTHVKFQRNFQLNPIMFSYIYSSLSSAGSRP